MAKKKKTTKGKARRSTLGSDPLDALVPTKAAKRASKSSKKDLSTSRSRPPQKADTKPPKVRATFPLPLDLFDQARDAVYWTPGLTLASLAEKALRVELAKLEKKNGGPFKERAGQLKGGRPVGS